MDIPDKIFAGLACAALIAILVMEHGRVSNPATTDQPDDRLNTSVTPENTADIDAPAYLVANLPVRRIDDITVPTVGNPC